MNHRSLLTLVASALAALPLMGASCNIIIDGECPNLDEVCPDLECSEFAENSDGCSICECEDEPAPTACLQNSDCDAGRVCDTVNFCERDPACEGDANCDAVCYGRCVEGADACTSDADCGQGEFCSFGAIDDAAPPDQRPEDPEEPAPEPGCGSDADCGEGARCENGVCTNGGLIAPEGICLPLNCPADLREECPEGFVPVLIDDGVCGRWECVPEGLSCEQRSPEICLDDPNCELLTDEGGGARPAPPCECAPDDADCACGEDPIPPPTRCVTRTECLDDNSCGPGQRCEIVTRCEDCGGTGTGGDGEDCAAVCIDIGRCVDDVPVEECFDDADCGPGAICQLADNCGSPNGLVACGGVCVEVQVNCSVDADCGQGEICTFPDQCTFPGGLIAPCLGVCAAVEVGCDDDSDCAEGEICPVPECCQETPNGLVCDDSCDQRRVCERREPQPVDGTCLSDDQCGPDAACINHPDVCLGFGDLPVCAGWCVTACGDALTPAIDPASGQCIVFTDTCIPPGWVAVNGCETPEGP